MRLFGHTGKGYWIFVAAWLLALAGVVILLCPSPVLSAPVRTESSIELIRQAQRECLKREPAHSFSLVQARGGYRIQCEVIK